MDTDSFKTCQQPIKLITTTDWYPYIYQENNLSVGLDIQVLTYILDKMNCQLQVLNFPERRSLFEMESGNFDIGLGASKNPERQKEFNFSVPYRYERNRFAYRESDLLLSQLSTIEDLVKAKQLIAINLAGWYGEAIEKAKSEYNGFIYSDTVDKRLKMLNFKRIDIVIDDDIVLCSELERSTFSEIKIHHSLLSAAEIHFIFNKKTVSLSFIKRFNQILTTMKKSGELAALYSSQLSSQCMSLLTVD